MRILRFEDVPEGFRKGLKEPLGYARLLHNGAPWFGLNMSDLEMDIWYPVIKIHAPGDRVASDLDQNHTTWTFMVQDFVGWYDLWGSEYCDNCHVFQYLSIHRFSYLKNPVTAAIASGEIFR